MILLVQEQFMVYSLIMNPDEDDSQFDAGHYNEMKVAAVGNFFIRIAAGQTPQIGDLIEANGADVVYVKVMILSDQKLLVRSQAPHHKKHMMMVHSC